MSEEITLCKGGTAERVVSADHIQIPDLWHVAMALPEGPAREAVLETWRLAHDLLRHIRDK